MHPTKIRLDSLSESTTTKWESLMKRSAVCKNKSKTEIIISDSLSLSLEKNKPPMMPSSIKWMLIIDHCKILTTIFKEITIEFLKVKNSYKNHSENKDKGVLLVNHK